MIITNLVRYGKSELYKTFVDDEYICMLEAEILVKEKIKIGTELTQNEFLNIREQSEKITCKNVALKYVSKSLKTKKQVKDNLKQKGYLPSSIEYAINMLASYGYLDDKYFAECYIKSKPQKGKLYLKNQLKQKGIADSVINEVLNDYQVDEDQIVSLAKKFVKNKPKDIGTKQKLFRHLLSKGFEYDQINRVVNVVFKDLDIDTDF